MVKSYTKSSQTTLPRISLSILAGLIGDSTNSQSYFELAKQLKSHFLWSNPDKIAEYLIMIQRDRCTDAGTPECPEFAALIIAKYFGCDLDKSKWHPRKTKTSGKTIGNITNLISELSAAHDEIAKLKNKVADLGQQLESTNHDCERSPKGKGSQPERAWKSNLGDSPDLHRATLEFVGVLRLYKPDILESMQENEATKAHKVSIRIEDIIWLLQTAVRLIDGNDSFAIPLARKPQP